MNVISQDEFDDLAIFVTVVDEIQHEPFFSEDSHDILSNAGGVFAASFCHPAFLKSAILPFRKLWLQSERCAFAKMRNFVYAVHPDQRRTNAYRYWFYESYDKQLAEEVCEQPGLTVKDVIEIWIYTHAVHAGPKGVTPKDRNKAHRTLQEFDHWDRILGRARFEFQFRVHLAVIGSLFVGFARELAGPLYCKLRDENGMKPGFEANAALLHNPYPDSKLNITFDDDAFWHLDKESLEETFDRLLARQCFQSVQHFFVAFFPTRAAAIAAAGEFSTLDALLSGVKASFLKDDEKTEAKLQFRGGGGSSPGCVRFEAYDDQIIRIDEEELNKLREHYSTFRQRLQEERKYQRKRPRWAFQTRWDFSY
jgi:hypothetical protein